MKKEVIMDEKQQYILKSLSKIRNKKWEFFIISRIIHLLSDDEVEFVTQQIVHPPESNSWYLTDLYFPQFGIHLEIDERHHLTQTEKDKERHRDIVAATNERIERISTFHGDSETKALKFIRADVDAFVDLIRNKKLEQEKAGNFISWTMSQEKRISTVLDRGYVSIEDNVTFRLQTGPLRCFGFTGISYQRGGWRIPDGTGDWVWFPRLYQHSIWENQITGDGTIIHQKAMSDKAISQNIKQIKEAKDVLRPKTIVFAKGQDNLGNKRLRYVGTFRINPGQSDAGAVRFDRISTWERTRAN